MDLSGSDLPICNLVATQALQDRFGGWEGSDILPAFANYSETVFRLLGRRVTYWTTMNEPQSFCFLGYSAGTHAPGVKSLVTSS